LYYEIPHCLLQKKAVNHSPLSKCVVAYSLDAKSQEQEPKAEMNPNRGTAAAAETNQQGAWNWRASNEAGSR